MAKEVVKVRGVFEKDPGSGVWWIRYADEAGRIRREKAGTKGNALELYRKRKTEILQGKKLPEKLRQASVSFAQIAADVLEYSRATKVKEAARIDSWHMETLLGWFGGYTAEQINPQDIERKLTALADEGRRPATVNRYRALLSLVFSLALRNGKVLSNPVRLVKPRKENNERVRFLDEREETGLRKVIRERFPEHEAEFDLAMNTGMRRGEQYHLRWQEVDLKRGIITILRSKHGEARHVHLNSAARAALLKLQDRRGDSKYVCPAHDCARTRDWDQWFNSAIAEAKIVNFR